MKKLKKFAALLLVGVMALALLTACGGGGGPTEEQKVLAQISQEKGVQATNDAELRAIAEGHLNMDRKNLDAKFKVAGYAGAFNFHTDRLEGDLVITITARYDYKDTLLSDVLNKIYNYEDYNASVKQDGNWSNIGVVVKSNNEQSYIGISIRIKNIYK
ncbi:MAG: hypothetical protein OGM79_11885 [Oscillospiraceae bacterium]|jgi:hypothetical protein|nr:MAG: hypothetical protein OGM79_11885 [Oscillospiraceae bacterium]